MYKKPISLPAIIAIVLSLTTVIAAGAFIWAYGQMLHYKNDADTIVAEAVVDAKDQQFQADELTFSEEAKKPYNQFAGPSDFGSVSFDYPKTWSVYNAKNDKDGYQVYFYPDIMPPIGEDTALALRLSVENKSYDEAIKSYSGDAEKGTLTATPWTVGQTNDFAGFKGMRLDGQIGKNLSSSMVLFKVRDKTLVLRTDATTWLGDFDNIVLNSLKFVP
jgi:hypothetical protein